jgi:acetolactate synthase I/II/III large subunit
VLQEHLARKPRRRLQPDAADVAHAASLLREARRPLVVTGRGARGCGTALTRLLDATGAVYLDTQESRGLVDAGHASVVGAMRARAMAEADLVLVVGRQLDYQLAYGSPAVFKVARFVRIADHADELRDNRRGEVELLADASLALDALAEAVARPSSALDAAWSKALRTEHLRRALKHIEELERSGPGRDGHMHPNRIFGALRQVLKPDAITIADGGDLLSFARMGLETKHYLDAGAFGCLGVGTPYGVAAGLLYPDRQVVVVTGDGAFGINAMEIDSAMRHGAKLVVIVSNNAAWNIERLDQEMNYGGRVVGTTLAWSDYAGMARAFGLHAERVTEPARLHGAIEEAFAKAPALIDVVTTQDALSSDAGKGLGWVPDRQALAAWDEAERARRSWA